MKIYKVVYYYKNKEKENNEYVKEYEFNTSYGTSKKILDDLKNDDLYLIKEIKTKEEYKLVKFNKINDEKEYTMEFSKKEFSHNKYIVHYLTKYENLEFINSIHSIWKIV
jgi:hypothetical protein